MWTVSWGWLINTYLISSFYGDGLNYGSTETDFLSDHDWVECSENKMGFLSLFYGQWSTCRQTNTAKQQHTQSDSFMCCIVPHMRALEAIRTAYVHKAYNLRSKLDSFGISYWSQGVKESLKLCSTFWAAVCVDRQELPMKDKAPLQASRGFGPRSNTLHVPGVLLVL